MGNKKVKIFNDLLNLITENQKLIPPMRIAEGRVIENWIDYNDHMNMAYYVQCFEESSDFILEYFDLGYNYAISRKKGVFVIKCEINYKKEIKLGEKFFISLEGIVFQGKKLILNLSMIDDQSNVCADYEILNLNVDLKTKKSISFNREELKY